MKLSDKVPWLLAAIFAVLAALLLACSILPQPNPASNAGSLGTKAALSAPKAGGAQIALTVHSAWNAVTWQKPSDGQLKAMLSPLQYEVTQLEGTEQAFNNEYWNSHQDGIYVDIVSGEPLFSSKDKYDSGTGWPSFTKPMSNSSITIRADYLLGVPRNEVRSGLADSHLGHVFDDGPPPLGLRYCMNSAALRFVPKDQMAALGYGAYLNELNT